MRLATLALLVSAAASAQVGTLDPAFGTGGIVVDDFETYDDIYAVAAMPDGVLAIAGASQGAGPNTRSARFFRYDAAGSLLGEWSYDNGVFGCSNVPEAFFDLVVEPGGTVLAGGYAQFDCGGPQRDFWIHRIQPDGTSQIFARPAFYGVFENAWALARHPDGRLTAGGIASPDVTNETRDLAFTRYTPDGEVDLTFGTMGETTVDVYGDYDFLYDLLAMPDGGVLAAGFAYDGSQYDLLLVRLDADGMPHTAFGTDGIVTIDFDGGDDNVFNLARQPDGQVVAVGQRGNSDGSIQPLILRFAPDGTLDPTFGTGGVVEVPFGGGRAFASELILQSDGKVVVAGGAGEDGARDVAIARFLPDGSLDASFGTGGMQTASWSEHDDIVRSLTITPDGDLVVLGITLEIVDGEQLRDLGLARFVGDTPPVANEEAPTDDGLALTVAPNPFRGSGLLVYALDEPGTVRLSLHDALGREVALLVDGPRSAGQHEEALDVSGLPAGVYLAWLQTEGAVRTQSVTVVR